MNKKLCTVLHLVYHALFSSTMYVAGSSYVNELKALRNDINKQSERITSMINKAELACKKLTRIKL